MECLIRGGLDFAIQRARSVRSAEDLVPFHENTCTLQRFCARDLNARII